MRYHIIRLGGQHGKLSVRVLEENEKSEYILASRLDWPFTGEGRQHAVAYMVLLGKVNDVEIETDGDTPPEIFYLD